MNEPLLLDRPVISALEIKPCPCAGRKRPGCRACLWWTWTWSDGRPPTRCPLQPSVPCGRHNAACRGCGRAAAAIGGREDVARALHARGLL